MLRVMLPFYEVIREVCGCEVLQVNSENPADEALVRRLVRVADSAMRETRRFPIVRSRPNEVGNDVEAYVKSAIAEDPGLELVSMGRSTGYPDILVRVDDRRWVYIECKTYSQRNVDASLRSFYMSPSRSFKVKYDAVHMALSFGMSSEPVGDGHNEYTAFGFKIVDLYDLPCYLKSEWNSSNRELYSSTRLLAESSPSDYDAGK